MTDTVAYYMLIAYIFGVLSAEGYHVARDYMTNPMSPEELEGLAADLRKSGGKSEVLAQVAERLAQGDDPDQIINDLPEDVRGDFELYLKGEKGNGK